MTTILAIVPSDSSAQAPRDVMLRHDGVFAVVDDFEYLGRHHHQRLQCDQYANQQGCRSFGRVLWHQRGVKMRTKLRIFKSMVLPTLLYGSETWAPVASQVKRLQHFVMKCVRVILCVFLVCVCVCVCVCRCECRCVCLWLMCVCVKVLYVLMFVLHVCMCHVSMRMPTHTQT